MKESDHAWTKEERMAVIDAYFNKLSKDEYSAIAESYGIKPGSFRMAMQNVEYLDTDEASGQRNVSKPMRNDFDEYKRNKELGGNITLAPFHKRIASVLLEVIKSDKKEITYEQLSARLDNFPQWNLGNLLGRVSEFCNQLGLPPLSAIVVNKSGDNVGLPNLGGFLGIPYIQKEFENYFPNASFREQSFCNMKKRQVGEWQDWSLLEAYIEGKPVNIARPKPVQSLPLEIRIIPMAKAEFESDGGLESYVDIQNKYFLNQLINTQGGKFYRNKGIRTAGAGSLFLFQYENKIIASAIFLKNVDESNGEYQGYFLFDKSSIKVFKPISPDELRAVVSDFNGFNQSMQNIPIAYQSQIEGLITAKQLQVEMESDALFICEVDQAPEPQGQVSFAPVNKVQMTNNASTGYARKPERAKAALKSVGYICELCGTERLFKKENGQWYVEAHHLIPMKLEATDTFTKSIDNPANIVSLCSFHHNLLHYGRVDEKKPLLEKLHTDRTNKLKEGEIFLLLDKLLEEY